MFVIVSQMGRRPTEIELRREEERDGERFSHFESVERGGHLSNVLFEGGKLAWQTRGEEEELVGI